MNIDTVWITPVTWHTIGMYFSTLPPDVMKPHHDLNKEFSKYYKEETLRLFGPSPEFTIEQRAVVLERNPGIMHMRLSAADWGGISSPDANTMALVAYCKHAARCREWTASDTRYLALTEELSRGRDALEKMKFVNHDLCIPGTLVRMSDGKDYVIGGVVGTRDIDCDSIPHDGLVLECRVLL